MVFVGVTIEDGSSDGLFDVTYLALDGSNQTKVIKSLPVGPGTGIDPSTQDLEGLARVGNDRVLAISESNFTDPTNGIIFDRVDTLATRRTLFDKSPNDVGIRFGDDSGFAAQVKDGVVTAYNVQGSDEVAPIGSAFYKVTPSPTGVPREVDEINPSLKNPVTGENEFADSLAIKGNGDKIQFALAADLENADGDGNELYTINLATGQIGDIAKIRLVTVGANKSVSIIPGSGGGNFNSDSGLGFTPKGGKQLFLLADGGLPGQGNDLYELFSAGSTNPNSANFNIPGVLTKASITGDLPDFVNFAKIGDFAAEGSQPGLGEYEGLGIVDIPDPF